MLTLLAAIGIAITAADTTPARRNDVLVEHLRNRIEAAGASGAIDIGDDRVLATQALSRFYVGRLYRPAWVDSSGLSPRVGALVQAVRGAAAEGLRPRDYHLDHILAAAALVHRQTRERRPPDVAQLVDLDLLCTDAFVLLGSHYLAGRVNPETIDAEWSANRRGAQLESVLESALAAGDIGEALRRLLPQQPGYARLRDGLAQYRSLAAAGGWPSVPAGVRLAPLDRDSTVPLLRSRLALFDAVDRGAGADPTLYDSTLVEAVRRFQVRHGLDVTGVVDSGTAAALNVPVEDRIRQIELNLERWRWLPEDLGRRHVIVNIAGFDLDVVDAGSVVRSMRVMVGRTYRRTPVFSGMMTYLVLAPYWHVPRNLAVQDQLPLIRRDAGHFATQGIRVFLGSGADAEEIDPATVDWSKVGPRDFPYRLRQDPGPRNALGGVKFMFPNKFNVYLHDTPSRELFDRPQRDFSSGCIRVEQPIELAEFLLAGTEWTRERLLTAITRRQEQTVRLPSPVPVHILYWTAWAERDGTIQFRQDIYDRDGRLAGALREETPADE
jgi:murein L,D-transpeptidase YcbB/YkuD